MVAQVWPCLRRLWRAAQGVLEVMAGFTPDFEDTAPGLVTLGTVNDQLYGIFIKADLFEKLTAATEPATRA